MLRRRRRVRGGCAEVLRARARDAALAKAEVVARAYAADRLSRNGARAAERSRLLREPRGGLRVRRYGRGITAIGAAALERRGKAAPPEALEANRLARAAGVPHVAFYDPTLDAALGAPGPAKDAVEAFFRLLAVCHTVLVEDGAPEEAPPPPPPPPRRGFFGRRSQSPPPARPASKMAPAARKARFSASSPDDEALVCGARRVGRARLRFFSLASRRTAPLSSRPDVSARFLFDERGPRLSLRGRTSPLGSSSDERGRLREAVPSRRAVARGDRVGGARPARRTRAASSKTSSRSRGAGRRRERRVSKPRRHFGLAFERRSPGKLTVRNQLRGRDEVYEVIELLDFTSARKRMSVVARALDDRGAPIGPVTIYLKGADTAVEPRLRPGQDANKNKTFDAMGAFSAEGLRTLVCAQAELPLQKFETWLTSYRAAAADLREVRKRQRDEPNAIDRLMDEVEHAFGDGLQLVGATAIEDRLQDGVPETVASLLEAGMRVWVLTGDKMETAINIGVACRLVEPPDTMAQIVVDAAVYRDAAERASSSLGPDADKRARRGAADAASRETLQGVFERETRSLSEAVGAYRSGDAAPPPLPRALIVDGEALRHALEADAGDDAPCRRALLDLAKHCKAVVACRVSPARRPSEKLARRS